MREIFCSNNKISTVVILLTVALLSVGCGSGGSGTSSSAGAGGQSSVPSAPQYTAVLVGRASGEALIKWGSVENASSYKLYVSPLPGVNKSNYISKLATVYTSVGPWLNISGLNDDTPYYMVVTAVNNSGESAETSEEVFYPGYLPPPLAPSAVGGDGIITVDWAPADVSRQVVVYANTSPNVTSYGCGGSPDCRSYSGWDKPATVLGVTNGKLYYVVVTYVDQKIGVLQSTESVEVTAVPWKP